jgi:hypothetical protein
MGSPFQLYPLELHLSRRRLIFFLPAGGESRKVDNEDKGNVAISRAQALAVVVASGRLGDVRVRSVREMQQVSGWCRIEECVS